MKKLVALLAATLSGALTLTAAPTADVYWNGDFADGMSLTGVSGVTYTLSANGNIMENGKITIAENTQKGVVISGSEGLGTQVAVLIKYTDLSTSQEAAVTSVKMTDGNYTGLRIRAADSNELTGFYEASTGNNYAFAVAGGTGDNAHPRPDVDGGYILLTYSSGGYTGCYVGTSLASLTGGYRNALTWSDRIVQHFAVGGPIDDTYYPACSGMKIEAVAIFRNTTYNGTTVTAFSDYTFPTRIVFDSATVTATQINTAANGADVVDAVVPSGATITFDTSLSPSKVLFSCAGNITLSASSQPSAEELAKVDLSSVSGYAARSWLPTPGVVGFNFNADGYRSDNASTTTDGCNDTALALEIGTWYKNGRNASGSSTELFADSLSKLIWSSANVYAEQRNISDGTFIQGYVDDGNGGATISLTGVPYETYDVIIYCSTDDSSKSFKAKTVNGTIYTWDSTAGETTTTSSDTATWGLASAAAGKAVYGANTLRINGLSGALSIKGGTNGNNARGCISAIQIMPAGTSTAPEMTVGTAGQTTQANWTDALWNVATAPTSGNVIINVSGDVELTVDETVALSAITVTGTGSLKIIPDQQNNVTFTASSISSSAVPLLFANDGIGIATISASVTYLYKTTSINSSTYGNTYTAGVGAQGSSVAISHNGGSVTLQGATYYLGESHNATATTVTFDDATAVYADCGVGMATYNVEGSSSITAQRLILSQGAAGRTAVMTIKDTASVNVTGTSDIDSNAASIMFGHWNGPSTFTIQDSATFTAASQVLVGKTANNHTINVNGGTFTAKGVKASSSASGTNTLNLNGGLLVLGDVGITSYGSTTISVNVLDDSEIRASAATLPISQAVTIAADKVLSFTKDSGVAATVVTLSGAVSGTGGISVGAGVTLNLGTNRPEGEISVDADGTIAVVMTNKADLPVLKVASEPASVILYDTDGETVLSGASVEYDGDAGTITVKPPVNTWNVSENLSFDTAANWTSGLPESTQDTAIKVTEDVALTIVGTYEAATLTVSGSGVVEFSGEGSFTVETLYLNGGATLAPDSKVSASSIVLASGTVLRLKDKTEATPISGAGAVETYGNVTFSGNNAFTGGLTVKAGSMARTETQQGFGKNNWGQAIANLSRIVVENGGSLDLKNTKDACYAITIAGKGVEDNGVYSGALFNSGEEIGQGSRQTASLTLSADAMVRAEASTNGWGIVNSGHAASVLALNGHTLTVSGAGYFPIVKANTADGTQTTGTLIADGVTLGLVEVASNFTGVDVIAKGCATINIATAPTALGSLTIMPSSTGTTASGWTLPSSPLPIVDTSNVDPTGLTDGQVLTIFTAPNATELSSATISVQTSTRFTSELDGNLVKVTFNAGMPANFMHYDFDNGAAVNTGKAADSGTQISSVGEAGSVTLVNSKNGQAVHVHTGYTPYWDTLVNGTSPFHAGAVTVTTVAKMKQTGVILWGLGNTNNSNPAMGLAVLDSTTAAVYARTTSGTVEKVVEVTGTEDLTKGYHFYAVVATATGTTLYVDNLSQASDKGVSSKIGQMGQLGSFHGGKIGSNKVGDAGYYLDDWRVYDTALTKAEVKTIKREVCPDPLYIRLR